MAAAAFAAELETSSKVTAVTVYRSMARETRSGTANLPAGNTEVVLSGVSMELLDPSIQVAVRGEAVLLSASVRTNYFQDAAPVEQTPRMARLQDSIRAIELELRWVAEEEGVHSGELRLVADLLHSATTREEYKPGDLVACADIHRTRVMELTKKLFDLQLRKEGLEERLLLHQLQLSEMGPKPKAPVKEIVLSFWAEEPGLVQVKAMYLVRAAGWVPMYDLSVANTSRPVAISYKANIFQSTGRDWKDVHLTVSTSTPAMNNDRPILSPRFVDYVTYALMPVTSTIVTNNMYIATPLQNGPATEDNPYLVTTGQGDIHVDYTIQISQTIPSDGKQHICKLQDYDVPATYRYHTVPKLDAGAFLLARITDYGQYNFLPGKANVFFGDTYVGQVDLNPQVTGDTLLVSLGRDQNIVVKRTRIEEKTTKKLVGDKQEEHFAYAITVRNNKGAPIHIEVLDQVPLTRKPDEIKVKVAEKSGAEYEETYGRILWQLKVEAGKSKTVELVYTVEYPKGKTISEQ